MRVLIGVHHLLDPHAGASGSVMEIGARLAARGHDVDFFGFDQAFRETEHERKWQYVTFPWAIAAHLARHRRGYDVADISIGDVWVDRSLFRRMKNHPAVVGRSHGLETLAIPAELELMRSDGRIASRRFRAYHAGYRLWEVRRSIRSADHCILLNHLELEHVLQWSGRNKSAFSVIPHGVSDLYLRPAAPPPLDGPVRIAFVGTWIPRKGTGTLVRAVRAARAAGVDLRVSAVGTVRPAEEVIAEFDERDRGVVDVVERYDNADLPNLLSGCHALLFLSNFEGFGKVVIEAMARGLVPITTPVGVSVDAVREGVTGIVVPPYNAEAVTEAIKRLAAEPTWLKTLGIAARRAAEGYTWDAAVDMTEAAYDRALADSTRRAVS